MPLPVFFDYEYSKENTTSFCSVAICRGAPHNITDNSMKYLIVGLGNIGNEYDGTRHNIGFRVVDALAEAQGASFQDKRYGFICKTRVKNAELLLLKPST